MKMQRKPAHPGRILRNMYLKPLDITITRLAEFLCVSRKAVSAIVNERKSVTPEMALRLSQAFGTTPDLWLNLQKKHDLWCASNDTQEWKNIQQIYQVKPLCDS
ncbi:MAG: HigA family addiction module antidote protein [Desulfobacterales bacterium]|nr:HigA family addiction module antidote protein [Desulfobacterales bacterium]